MNVAFQPMSLGFIVAIIVLILAIIMMVGVLPISPIVVGGLIAGLAVARMV
jgi:hypothetical protein